MKRSKPSSAPAPEMYNGPVATALETNDVGTQVERIKQLADLARAPQYVVTIVFDSRIGQPVVWASESTGKPIEYRKLLALLDESRTAIVAHQTNLDNAKAKAEAPTPAG